jgi:16S rRNA (cytosine967-C5)-methyltransferase
MPQSERYGSSDERKYNKSEENAEFVLYRTAREIAVKILNRVDRTDSYLDKILDFELRNSDLSRIDKTFLTELVKGTTRWKLKVDYIIDQFYRGDLSKLDINIKNAIRLAVYQLVFLEKIPQWAAVDEAVKFVKRLRGQTSANIVNAVLRTIIRKINLIEYPSVDDDPVGALSVTYSYPPWLVRKFVDRFGIFETEQLLDALNERPLLSVRVNTNKTSTDVLAEEFRHQGAEVSCGKFLPNFLYVEGFSAIAETDLFRKGLFTIQDESAGIVSVLLAPTRGDKILDACAAPGGKTTHILELTNGEVDIVALEKYEHRAHLLRNSLEAKGYTNVQVIVTDAAKYSSSVIFDKILVDAPCSGMGAIRKKPDVKWKRSEDDIIAATEIQSAILENVTKFLKPNGVVVYSTCTIVPDENQNIIHRFLSNHPEFVLESADVFVNRTLVNREGFVEMFPHRHDLDGGFAARLRKIG